MVSGYWQQNSVIILIFPTVLLSSIQFCLSDLDSGRKAVRFPDLGRENFYLNSIKRSAEENLRNGPFLSNNRYSEQLQAEITKGSNLNEVRHQKIRSVRLVKTGLNKIDNLIRVSESERYLECSALQGLSQSKCFSDSIENRRHLDQNGLVLGEKRQNRKLTQRMQENRITYEREIERKRDLPRNENLRQVRRERLQRRHLISESESLERALNDKEANRNLERNRRTQRNIPELSADERKNNVAIIESVRTFRRNSVEPKIEDMRLRIRETILFDRRQLNRATEDDMRSMSNFGRNIARNIRSQENNQVSRRHYRIDADRKMESRRIEGNKLSSRNNRRTQNSLIEERNNIRQDVERREMEMVQRVQQFSYRKQDRLRLERMRATQINRDLARTHNLRRIIRSNLNDEVFQNDQISGKLIERKMDQKRREERTTFIQEKDLSNRQENENFTNREQKDIREERETRREQTETRREDDSLRRDTSTRNMNRKREYENLMSRKQNQRDIRKEREALREEETRMEVREISQGREIRREERETRLEGASLQRDISARNVNPKQEYENLMRMERNQRDIREKRENYREGREVRREEEARREERETRREERENRREERETSFEGDSLQRDTSTRKMNHKREYENLKSMERNQRDIRKKRENYREGREVRREEETRREERETSLQRDISTRNVNPKREYENLMRMERNQRIIREKRENYEESRETRREERENRREERENRREERETSFEGQSPQRDTSARKINRKREYENIMSMERNQPDIRKKRENYREGREVRREEETRREEREIRRDERETNREKQDIRREVRETRREGNSLDRDTSAEKMNRRRETIRFNRRDHINQHVCHAPEISLKSMVVKNVETRNDRRTKTNISYLRSERLEVDDVLTSNNMGKNIWVNDNLLNQEPTPNIMLNLIQGLLIGAIALKAFSFQNSKNTIGAQLNSMMPMKCF